MKGRREEGERREKGRKGRRRVVITMGCGVTKGVAAEAVVVAAVQ